MIIHIFYPKKGFYLSIKRSFEPLVRELKKHHDVREFFVPYIGANPINMLRNILYVKKHRTEIGVNHIAGDIHYCILGLIGTKNVLTIHDDYAMRKSTHGWLGKMQKYLFWIWLPIKYADKVICITETTKKDIAKYYNNEKLQVIAHHCMNEDFHYFPKEFNKECPTIFQCGTDFHKNLDTLIAALEGIKCKLVVLVKMTSAQCNLAKEKHVVYKNYYNISNEEVYDLYKSADIVTFVSSYEGFGMPIIEGQCTGRIVITTNKEPMNWVAGKNCALFVNDPKNVEEYRKAILKTINDDEYRNNCIKNGLKNVKRFTLSNIYNQYVKVYSDERN